MPISDPDIVKRLEGAGLGGDEARQLFDALWEVVGKSLAVGDPVEVPGLGRFVTVKHPGKVSEGEGAISFPTVEPDFEPDPALEEAVRKGVAAHPELFKDDPAEDEAEDGKAAETRHPAAEAPPAPPPEAPAKPAAPPPPKEERPLGHASQIVYVDLGHITVEKDILALLPLPLAQRYNAVPIELKEGVLTVAMTDPEDFDALQFIRKETGLVIKPVLTSREDLTAIFDQYSGLQNELQEVLESGDFGISKQEIAEAQNENVLVEDNENAPTAKIVGSLLRRAVKEKASDIHIEPYEHKVVVRFRLDGVLVPRVELPKEVQSSIIARLKILAALKIDEQRLPQDGRFSLTIDRREVDFRLSTIPVVFGEKVVMRILDKQSGIRQLEEVGLVGDSLELLKRNIRRSHGMVLVTGPTGSGKTTTLYAVLSRLMTPDVNIVTLEDPVEYRIESINQSQVHHDIGYTFATGLRSIVRQDPDIVMLGEIRDKETAEMAVQAALTGHVVLSTLHTNDAAGAFPRLIDMGVEPFLITSSVHTVIAQRLTRGIDPDRRQERALTDEEAKEIVAELEGLPDIVKKHLEKEKIDIKEPKVYAPKPDGKGGSGYVGRIGIFEILDVTEPVRRLVLKRASGSEIKEQAVKDGMVTMIQDGLIKALKGQTSLEEVWRVTRE